VAAACFAPWSALGAYLQGTPAGLLEPLANLNPPPLLQGHLNILTLPLEISFPRPALPPFEVIGPIFLVFIPFFFITYRKNPASGLAVAIGLSFLGFGEPFGLALEARLAAFALLGVPAALAAHRFAEKGWRKTLAVAMLYLMIGWQIFHSTAMVENAYPSPDRFLLGLETSDQFLARAVDYYPAARWINDNLPADARLKALGQKELLYIHRLVSPTTPERGGELAVSLVNPQTRSGALAALREKGFGYLIVNWREPDSGDPPWPELQHALRSRLLYSGGPVGVYTLDPMPGQQESGGGEDEQEVF